MAAEIAKERAVRYPGSRGKHRRDYAMSQRAPVTDWLTDWDHLDPQWIEDPFPIWDGIRAAKCPIAHTERFRGAA